MIKDIVKEISEDFKKKLIDEMLKYGSKNLYQKIPDANIQETADYIISTMDVPKEVYYFSEGRGPGKPPPKEPIYKWMKDHQLVRFNNKITGRFLKDTQMVYLIQWKIAKLGTIQPSGKGKGAPFFLKPFGLTDEYKNKLSKAWLNEVKLDVISMLKKSQIGDIS